jgi:hypothetical protein
MSTRTAVLIGVQHYQSTDLTDLRSPRADIEALAEAIRRNCRFDQVRVLPNPTRAQALAAIEEPLSEGRRDDLVLVSFSGHGFLEKRTGRLNLALTDTRQDRPKTTAISAVDLHNLLKDSRVASKVLLLDCCYSGAFADGFGTRAAGAPAGIDFQRQLQSAEPELQGQGVGEGTYVLAASGAAQPAYEGEGTHGGPVRPSPFSQAVAEGLGGAAGDSNGDGWSDAIDLYQYVHRRVDDQEKQTVTGFNLGMQGTVRLARHGGSRTSAPLRPQSSGPQSPAAEDDRRTDTTAETADVPGRGPSGPGRSPDWPLVLDYLRACVGRESVLQQLPELGAREVAACPMGSELLLTGAAQDWPLRGDAVRRLVDGARGADHVLRYGYPTVLFPARVDGRGRGFSTRAAPLFVVDVQVVRREGADRLVPVSEPELNRALLSSAGELAPEDVAELLDWFRVDWVEDGVVGLSDKARAVCDRAGIDVLTDLQAGELQDTLYTTRPYHRGAQNAALLYRVGQADRASEQVLGDLDFRDRNGMDAGKVAHTALRALDVPAAPGSSAPAPPDSTRAPVLPVVTGRSNTAQERIVRAAMTRPLTVVTGAPGTGKSTLITAQVTTAVAAGQSVLVASTNNDAVDVVVDAVNALIEGSEVMVRTGNAAKREEEAAILTRMRALGLPHPPHETATAGHHLALAQHRIDRAHERLERVGAAEHRLAVLASSREALAQGLPAGLRREALNGSEPVLTWRARIERAVDPRWSRWPSRVWNRWRVRRGLEVDPTPLTADRLTAFLEVEHDWWLTHETVGGAASAQYEAEEQHGEIASARSERRDHAALYLAGTFTQGLAAGRRALDERIQALQGGNGGWRGIQRLLRAVPAWATTSRSVRATMPPREGLFDLVIVDEASQCTASDLVPLLYRAKRALVIGDPHQLAPVNTLDADDDRRIRERIGLDEEWLDERGLVYTRTSAYHVAAAAVTRGGEDVYWLDEHYRCHPDIVEPVNRRFYGGRLSVRTRPSGVAPADGPAVRWIDVAGRTDRPGNRSCRNTEEAERVRDLLRELWRELPEKATIGVVTPFRAQLRHIRSLLSPEAGRRIETGTVHTFQGRERDVIVVSPAAATGVGRTTGDWARRQQNLWNVAVTRARARLYIVGDRAYWTGKDGALADYAREPVEGAGDEVGGEARQRLFEALHRIGARPRAGERAGGYGCDLVFHTGGGERALLIDGAGVADPVVTAHGRVLERALDGAALFTEVSGVTTVRVPLWRCLTEPEALAAELAGSAPG